MQDTHLEVEQQASGRRSAVDDGGRQSLDDVTGGQANVEQRPGDDELPDSDAKWDFNVVSPSPTPPPRVQFFEEAYRESSRSGTSPPSSLFSWSRPREALAEAGTRTSSHFIPQVSAAAGAVLINLDAHRIGRPIRNIFVRLFSFRRSNEDLKDIGGACALVSTFVALVAVGLLSYTNDIFTDQKRERPSDSPPPASNVAVTALFFTAVILSIAAAMEFTILQLTLTRTAPGGDDYEAEKSPIRRSGIRGVLSTRNVVGNIERMMASFCFILLFLSLATLFAGIFTFIWSNETHAVKIATTVVFGTLCLLPIGHVSLFIASFE